MLRLLSPGEQVDHFRITRMIQKGGMGEVYLARDTTLGRKVALKIISPERLSRPDAVSSFLREAKITAQFNHPHIVTIYSVGLYDKRPYLALEYLDGQSLRERLQDQRLALRECLRIGLAVAEALAEAHRAGVLHRDLKPPNIVLPTDGRLRVVDFGVARALDSAEPQTDASATRALATPRYMAPEQWLSQPLSPATDLWALGVILFEMIAGVRPFEQRDLVRLRLEVCSELPAPRLAESFEAPQALVELVAGCLEKDPSRRPSALEVAETLEHLLGGASTLGPIEASPFRGLLPFAERHAELFFGREAEVAEFVERLREAPILPVVGPSGAGKSSFVQAGVIPRLRDQGRWRVLRVRPGARPLQALAEALILQQAGEVEVELVGSQTLDLRSGAEPARPAVFNTGERVAVHAREQLAEKLRAAPQRVGLRLAELAEREECRVLLFVDQLEELFTLCPDREERRVFLDGLCDAADDPRGPVRVTFTVREDFLGRVAETPTAREALRHLVVLRSPGPTALRETLVEPLARLGYQFAEDDLPDEMVAAVEGEPNALPLLQFVAAQLWQRRDGEHKLITRAAYESIGGVVGALAGHADEALDGLTATEQRLARQLLLRLVTSEGTRRVVPRSELLDGLGDGAQRVCDRLVEWRAILVRRGRLSLEPDVELIHESLITSWQRLARWREEGHEEAVFLSDLGQAAELWERRGRRPDEVWRGPALQEALLRAARCEGLPERSRRFLEAGSRRQRRQALRRFAIVAGSLALLLVVVALLSKEAREQRRLSEDQRGLVEAQQAESLVEGARAAFERGDLEEARARLRSSMEIADSLDARVLWLSLRQQPSGSSETSPPAPEVTARFSPHGEILATGAGDGVIRLRDVETGGLRQEFEGHRGAVTDLAFSADGQRLVSAGADGTLRLWRAEDGAAERVLSSGVAPIDSLALSTRAGWIAAGDATPGIALWDTETGEMRLLRGEHRDPDLQVAFSPDGALLATAGRSGAVRLWEAGGWLVTRELQAGAGEILGLALSPDGERLAAGTAEGGLWIWELETDNTRLLSQEGARVSRPAFDPEAQRVGAPGSDGVARIWNLQTGEALLLEGHRGAVNAMAFSPDGLWVATAGDDATLRLWSSETGRPRWRGTAIIGDPPELSTHLGWTPMLPGQAPSRATTDLRQAVWEQALRADASQEGGLLCLWTFSDELQLWDTAADRLIRREPLAELEDLRAVSGGCLTLARGEAALHRRDGQTIALARAATAIGQGGEQLLVAARSEGLRFDLEGQPVGALALEPGARAIALLGEAILAGYHDGRVSLFGEGARGAPAAALSGAPSSPVTRLLPWVEEIVALGFADGVVGLWSLRSGRRLRQIALRGAVTQLRRQGRWLLAASDLGDHAALDLGPLDEPDCELLRSLRRENPTLWVRGRPVSPSASAADRCARR